MTHPRRLLVVALTSIAYFLLFELNNVLFSSLGYSKGVDWIFLPSGLRLVFILVFVEAGAAGIALASIFITHFYQADGQLFNSVVVGMISGLAPLLARRVCIDLLKLDVNLQKLTAATLLKAALVFAVMSSVLHQLWFSWRGQSENILSGTGVMMVGDFAGTVIMLYAAKFLLTKFMPERSATAE